MILLMMLIIIIALANQPLSHATEIWSHFRSSGWLRRDSKYPHIYSTVYVRTHTSNLESKQARKSSNCEVFVHLSPLRKIHTCEGKVFYWRCRGFKDWVTTSKLLFQPREVTGGLQLHFSQSVKNSNLSKSIKFLTKLHFNFIFPPPFYFSDIPYIVQFWYTTVLYTPVEVHQQVRKFTTR